MYAMRGICFICCRNLHYATKPCAYLYSEVGGFSITGTLRVAMNPNWFFEPPSIELCYVYNGNSCAGQR